MVVETVGFILDVGIWEHTDFAGVGGDLPRRGVADALGSQELLLGDGLGAGFDGEEGDRAVEECDDLRVTIIDGGEAEGHVE